jgi:hypothetical protein
MEGFQAHYVFLIDTDSYSGNFERPMTAFITGVYGEFGAQEEAYLMQDEEPDWYEVMENLVILLPDERGRLRATSIFPTPGWFNDGLGDHFRDEDWGDPKVAESYQKRVDQEHELHKQLYTHLEDPPPPKEFRGPGKHPSYQSVGIYLRERPDDKTTAFMCSRAYQYSKQPKRKPWDVRPKVEGFRLLYRYVAEDLLDRWVPQDDPERT